VKYVVRDEGEKDMGDYDISAWRRCGTCMALDHTVCWNEAILHNGRGTWSPSYRFYFGPRQTQEQSVAYREILLLVERPIHLFVEGIAAGMAPSDSAPARR
jgi:hypothetical protein